MFKQVEHYLTFCMHPFIPLCYTRYNNIWTFKNLENLFLNYFTSTKRNPFLYVIINLNIIIINLRISLSRIIHSVNDGFWFQQLLLLLFFFILNLYLYVHIYTLLLLLFVFFFLPNIEHVNQFGFSFLIYEYLDTIGTLSVPIVSVRERCTT